MTIRVKICGVRTVDGARAVRQAGADFAGLNLIPTSRRFVSPPLRREVRDALGAVLAVGVFADQEVASVREAGGALDLDLIQLHGSETPEDCAALARDFRVVKALRVDEGFDPARVEAFRPHVEYFLFDGPKPGSGEPFPWERLKGLDPGRPFFIAGGLTPENVTAAISRLTPFGVDTASGVEREAVLDPDRVRDFVRRARRG